MLISTPEYAAWLDEFLFQSLDWVDVDFDVGKCTGFVNLADVSIPRLG